MRANWDDLEEVYSIEGRDQAPRMFRIEGALGWLNRSGRDTALFHWFIVAAKKEDKGIIFLEEAYGPLDRLMDDVISAKDRLMIRRIHVDNRNEMIYRNIAGIDGLTKYRTKGQDLFGREQWYHPSDYWPDFRNRATKVSLVPILDDDLADIQAGYDKLVGALGRQETTLHAQLRHLPALLRMPVKDAMSHPGILAAIWVHSALSRKSGEHSYVTSPNLYPNATRG